MPNSNSCYLPSLLSSRSHPYSGNVIFEGRRGLHLGGRKEERNGREPMLYMDDVCIYYGDVLGLKS